MPRQPLMTQVQHWAKMAQTDHVTLTFALGGHGTYGWCGSSSFIHIPSLKFLGFAIWKIWSRCVSALMALVTLTFDHETGVRLVSKVGNLPSKCRHARPLGSRIICHVIIIIWFIKCSRPWLQRRWRQVSRGCRTFRTGGGLIIFDTNIETLTVLDVYVVIVVIIIIIIVVIIVTVWELIVLASEFLSIHPAPEEEVDDSPPRKKRNKVSFAANYYY